jgi:hypothetical protein
VGRRGRRESPFISGVSTAAREAVETRWYGRMTRQPQLAALVTAKGAPREPFHRWMNYAQGFSPELVRVFLREAEGLDPRRTNWPLLDPFSGSGTVVIECARQAVRAEGVEAMASLAFLSSLMGENSFPEPPALSDCTTWEQAADRLKLPIHRAALMYAVGRRHTSAGKPNPQAPPLLEAFEQVVRMMRDDLRKPLPVVNPVRQGDARRLEHVEAGAIGGILTSPPYLSRHDYTKVLRPYEVVYQHWYGGRSAAQRRTDQLPAHPDALARPSSAQAMPSAVEEACASLLAGGEKKLAAVVGAYFDDLFAVLAECRRVLRPGAPCWVVIGGARLRGVYVPSDSILADSAAAYGFTVRSVRVARNLINVGRKFGRLTSVAPRESVLVLRRQ